ncbi:SsgA family sporulation/cell division regulator [Streptomyces sp. NPDC007205]|uniref:SsgA family sporulation/cell division regulator n=1 Tax=Streptomyces sp. NPDC007205 TaxID=3154316 RepID=UPI0033C6FFEB
MFKFLRNVRLHRPAGKHQRYTRPHWEGHGSSTDGGTISQATRVRLTAAFNQQISVPVILRYSSTDPLAVHVDFPALVSSDGTDMTWSFDRGLLANGLCRPTGIGDVRIWPSGRVYTIIEFRSSEGRAFAKFDTAALIRFLLRSYVLVEHGKEDMGPAIEGGLATLLDEV